jgi:hypothetical protein
MHAICTRFRRRRSGGNAAPGSTARGKQRQPSVRKACNKDDDFDDDVADDGVCVAGVDEQFCDGVAVVDDLDAEVGVVVEESATCGTGTRW